MQAVGSHPSVQQAVTLSKEYIDLGSAKLSELYVEAKPFAAQATQTLTVYMKMIVDKGQDAMPIIMKAISSIGKATDEFMKSEAVSYAL